MFTLHTTLARDTFFVTDYPLCEVRLMDNRLFPWLVLIPKRADASEWIDLDRADQHQLSDEIAICSHIFQALTTPDKLNIAALGNQVPQLHVHLIGRYRNDPAWPAPVWGKRSESYGEDERQKFIYELKIAMESAI